MVLLLIISTTGAIKIAMNYESFNFSGANVIVIGDVMLDQYWYGNVARISPEAPVPVVSVNKIDDRIGGAGNVASNIAALGSKVSLLSCVGVDQAAQVLQSLLEQSGVDHHLESFADVPTTTKMRVIGQQQQLIRLDLEESCAKKKENLFADKLQELLPKAQVIVLSDYAKGVLVDSQAFIEKALEHNIKVVIDPKKKDFSCYKNATVVTPNLKEFQEVVGECKSEEDIVSKGRNLIRENNIEYLLLTCGADGMWVISADGSAATHIPSRSNEVYDVTGAGDTVVAVIAAGLASGMTVNRAAHLASIAAALAVSKVGTTIVTLDELKKASMHKGNNLPQGIISTDKLTPIIKDLQSKGEKIVFINGCYDILHHGHMKFINTAKKLGDRLIVGVNTDESVEKLKGKDRPVNNLANRMEVLAELKSIDWVVSFAELTPGKLVEALSPDILVKTGEHYQSIDEIPETEGTKAVLSKGGEVHIIPRTPDVSTTEILENATV